MVVVYLGLGSNMGERRYNIFKALSFLRDNGVRISACSSIIETEPVGGPAGQRKYLNAVVKAETDLSPYNLLKLIHQIEHSLGRVRTIKNGPRTIDIDILLYGHTVMHTPELTIPHPRMFSRDFVMIPLVEIYPEVKKEYFYACN